MLPQDQVTAAVRLTFEEMAFLDVNPGAADPPGPPAEEGPVLFLSYTLPRGGAFALFLPKALKFQVAEAIYGENWNLISSIQLDDSLLELLNVLAGRLLTERFGQDTVYSMGLPTVLYDPPGIFPGMGQREFCFHVDEHEFNLIWYEVPA